MTKLGVADRGARGRGRPALEMLRLGARRVQIEAPPQPPASSGGTRQEEGGRFRDSADGRRMGMVGSWWRVDTAGQQNPFLMKRSMRVMLQMFRYRCCSTEPISDETLGITVQTPVDDGEIADVDELIGSPSIAMWLALAVWALCCQSPLNRSTVSI
jgi:hypothetical protein